MTYVNSIAKRE